ncbi:hypothetical protein H5410_001648 [Solanum commersonii]|uniref:DUF1985 domain-containing protein n=1 Tax=Solanum commersonii TaxID=4109 RepID=A0A9J6B080_SOLCO|nr:hypothetical protein H5410_001648 [Solanum commersonii]
MEPHDEFVEMLTPVGEPNFHLLSPTPVSDSNCCNIQSVSFLPLSTIDHSGVDRQMEERSKEYLRRRKLEEIKKGKSIALDPKDQGRSVNNWEFYFEVDKHKKPKLGATNLDFIKSFEEKLTKSQLQIFSDTCFRFFLKLPPVILQTQLIHSLLMMEVVQEKTDEIWLPVNGSLIHFGLDEFAIMTGLKCNGDPTILSWKVLSSPNATKVSEMLSATKVKVRNISATPFEKSVMNLNDLVGDVVVNDESNGAEVGSQLVDDDFTTPPPVSRKTSTKPTFYEEFRGRGVNVDCDEEYYENNINCDQHVTLHLDNIQTINEDSNNDVKIVACKHIDKSCYPKVEHIVTGHLTRNRRSDAFHQSPYLNSYGSSDNMSGGASSKSIVIGVHPFGSFNLDVDCLKEMGEFREWMNEGHRACNKKYPYIKKDNTLNPPFEFGKMIISKKDWFYKFAFSGQSLENSDVVKPEHDIAKYILGEFVFSNRSWHIVDHILFPLCVDEQWVMEILSFKDRLIYVYDSMGDAAFRANIRSSVDAYRFIIPLFLLILNCSEKRTDIQLNDGPYMNKALVDPFNVVMIKDLPDRGIYVALFAARFICGRNVFDNEFDVNSHRIKFGSLLWNYGKMKLEKHITTAPEHRVLSLAQFNQSVATKLSTGTGWPPCKVHFKPQWCQWEEQPPCHLAPW